MPKSKDLNTRNLEFLYKKVNSNFLFITLQIMIFSYFYNLGIVEFSFLGENPIRIYDLTGIVLLYTFFLNYRFVYHFLISLPFLKWFWYFAVYAFITLIIFTIPYCLSELDVFRIIQSFIYFFHLLIFFLGGFFVLILSFNKKYLKSFIFTILFLSISEAILVILQNFGIVEYLWSEKIKNSYAGFNTGTLGPNKITLGITMLLAFSLSASFFFEKKIKINSILLIITLVLSLYVVLLSGSRTSYVGLIIFSAFYFIQKPTKLLITTFILGIALLLIQKYNFEMLNKIDKTFESRIENKIIIEDDENVVFGLYDDLGAGRLQLATSFLENLKDKYYFIPLGSGFNNRMLFSTSPHNMYLTLIRDVGLLGFYFYVSWLFSFFFIKNENYKSLIIGVKAIALAMIVTLFFGEHLYIFRPLYGLLGLFFIITSLIIAPILYKYNEK